MEDSGIEDPFDDLKLAPKITFDSLVAEITSNRRILNMAARENIKTVGDLASKTDSEILGYRDVGTGTLWHIKEALKGHGLTLGMKIPENGKQEPATLTTDLLKERVRQLQAENRQLKDWIIKEILKGKS